MTVTFVHAFLRALSLHQLVPPHAGPHSYPLTCLAMSFPSPPLPLLPRPVCPLGWPACWPPVQLFLAECHKPIHPPANTRADTRAVGHSCGCAVHTPTHPSVARLLLIRKARHVVKTVRCQHAMQMGALLHELVDLLLQNRLLTRPAYT